MTYSSSGKYVSRTVDNFVCPGAFCFMSLGNIKSTFFTCGINNPPQKSRVDWIIKQKFCRGKERDKLCYFIQKNRTPSGCDFIFGADEQIRTAYPAHSSAWSQRVAPKGASFCFLPHWAFASLYPPQAALGSAPITKIDSSRDR